MNQIMDSIQIRRRTPLPVMAYAVYLYYSNMSLRYAAKSLRSVIVRGYTSIWRWVQRLGPILGSFGADPRDVRRIFVDDHGERGRDLRVMPDFHVAGAGTRSTHIYSSGGPCISTAGSRSTPMVRDGTRTPADGPAWST
jgi:hypothetical protein